MPEFVRVRDKSTGHEGSILRARADQLGDAVEILDEPATGALGVRRPKPAQRGDVAPPTIEQPPADLAGEPAPPAAEPAAAPKPTRQIAPKEPVK